MPRPVSHPQIVAALEAERDAARRDPRPGRLDRLAVLERLAAQLGAEPEQLLLNGFDRAYRRIVEGV